MDVLRVHDEAELIVTRGVMVVWQDVGYSIQVSGASLSILSHHQVLLPSVPNLERTKVKRSQIKRMRAKLTCNERSFA